jgi:hypothetical protein
LRIVFLEDLLALPLEKEKKTRGLWDRQGNQWAVFDWMAPGKLPANPPCLVRLISRRHTADWMRSVLQAIWGASEGKPSELGLLYSRPIRELRVGAFSGVSGAGNGDYRGVLRQAVKGISAFLQAQSLQLCQAVVRLDGQYGNGAIVADPAGLTYVMQGKDYDLLDLQEVQARLAQPPDQQTTHPETGTCRALFDFSDLALSPTGPRTRVIVATHQAAPTKAPVGTTRGEMACLLFYTALPPGSFTPADVVALYLHRGACETVLSDEDEEQEPDRWCSHTVWGQEFWLILAQ